MPLSTALPPSSTSETLWWDGWDGWDGRDGWDGGFNGAQGFVGMKFQLVGHLNFPPKNQQQLSKIFLLAGSPHLPSFALYFQRSNAALTRMNWQGTRPCKAKRTCRDRVRMYDRPNLSKLCLWETSTFLIAFVPGTGNSSNGMSAFRTCTNSISNEPWSRLCDPKCWVAPPSNELWILGI